MSSLVSVIIPTFNRGHCIKKAVESVLAQTYQNLQVVVIDDGSTDSTRDVLAGIKDSRLQYVHTKNEGNYFARNTGLAQAKGDFISLLDSDDCYVPQKIAVQLDRFKNNPDLGLCCSNVYVKHQNIPDKVFEDAAHSFHFDIDNEGGFLEKAIESNFIVTSTVMIRKECVRRVGIFNTQFQNAMDYEYFLRIVFNFQALYMKDKLVERLIHSNSVSKNSVNTKNALVYIFTESVPLLEQGKLFSEKFRPLLEQAKERSLYMAGMEYLLSYNYKEAYAHLNRSRFNEKVFFKTFASAVAKYQLSPFVPLIAQYRAWRNYSSLHKNPSLLNTKF